MICIVALWFDGARAVHKEHEEATRTARARLALAFVHVVRSIPDGSTQPLGPETLFVEGHKLARPSTVATAGSTTVQDIQGGTHIGSPSQGPSSRGP
jgi:hypothetical protein